MNKEELSAQRAENGEKSCVEVERLRSVPIYLG